MEAEDSRKLAHYIDLVWSYYFNAEIDMPCNSIEEFLTHYVKPEYHGVLEDRKKLEPQWQNLLDELFKEKWVAGKPRDWSHRVYHGFYVIIRLNDPCSDMLGIVLRLSLIGKQFGFYYSDLHMRGKISQPIYEPTKRYFSGTNGPRFGTYNPDTCYFPFNENHIRCYPKIRSMVHKHFPGFTEFDNRFANFQIEGIQTDESFFDSMDLFQAFFGNDINGVI